MFINSLLWFQFSTKFVHWYLLCTSGLVKMRPEPDHANVPVLRKASQGLIGLNFAGPNGSNRACRALLSIPAGLAQAVTTPRVLMWFSRVLCTGREVSLSAKSPTVYCSRLPLRCRIACELPEGGIERRVARPPPVQSLPGIVERHPIRGDDARWASGPFQPPV